MGGMAFWLLRLMRWRGSVGRFGAGVIGAGEVSSRSVVEEWGPRRPSAFRIED